jgi:hypothetical protein
VNLHAGRCKRMQLYLHGIHLCPTLSLNSCYRCVMLCLQLLLDGQHIVLQAPYRSIG